MKIIRKTHYQKLIKLIEASGVIVKQLKNEDSLKSSAECWVLNRQRVNIGIADRPGWILACLAHEYGHCLSVQRGSTSNMGYNIQYRMGVRLPKKIKEKIYKEEQNAWTLGFRFLKQNNLPITDFMKWLRRYALRSHYKMLFNKNKLSKAF